MTKLNGIKTKRICDTISTSRFHSGFAKRQLIDGDIDEATYLIKQSITELREALTLIKKATGPTKIVQPQPVVHYDVNVWNYREGDAAMPAACGANDDIMSLTDNIKKGL
jgi:hypothetical protein